MSDPTDIELRQRLELIDRIVAEGRRGFEYYGWCFVLWGVGHLAALGWQQWLPHAELAWGVTMSFCGLIVMADWLRHLKHQRVETKIGRAVGAAWMAFGGALLVTFSCDRQHPLETFFLLIGVANVTSGITLRWTAQWIVGLLWWAAAAISLALGPGAAQLICFVAMALVGEIGFGIYLMLCERRDRARG